MAWKNDHVPTVRIQARDTYKGQLTEMARVLKYSGNPDLAEMVLQDKARLDNNVPTAVRSLANDEVDGASRLIKERQ